MEYTIESRDSYLEVKQSGLCELRVYGECLAAVLEHESWTPGTPTLVDQTELDAGTLTINEVRALATQCGARREEAGSSRLAILVARDLEFGMNRMWGVFVEDQWDVVLGVFRSKEEAVAWLTA